MDKKKAVELERIYSISPWPDDPETDKGREVFDAIKIHRLKQKFDFVLLYGLATPHFSPWKLVRIFASTGSLLNKKGVFIIYESDRKSSVFLKMGYKNILAEGDEEKFIISFHTGYDVYRGTFRRVLSAEFYLWGIAELLAFLWLFFKHVDAIPIGETGHFLICRTPRRRILPEDLKLPVFLKNKK